MPYTPLSIYPIINMPHYPIYTIINQQRKKEKIKIKIKYLTILYRETGATLKRNRSERSLIIHEIFQWCEWYEWWLIDVEIDDDLSTNKTTTRKTKVTHNRKRQKRKKHDDIILSILINTTNHLIIDTSNILIINNITKMMQMIYKIVPEIW